MLNTESKTPAEQQTAMTNLVLTFCENVPKMLKNIHEMQLIIYKLELSLDERLRKIEEGTSKNE